MNTEKTKDTYWFPHDSNARNDLRIVQMSAKWKYGYQWYFQLIEILREEAEYKINSKAISAVAIQLKEDEQTIKEWLADCCSPHLDLFKTDGSWLWSESLIRRMRRKDEISAKNAQNAQKRWSRTQSTPKNIKGAIPNLAETSVKTTRPAKQTDSAQLAEFNEFWELYNKKVGRKDTVMKKFCSLKKEERMAIMENVPLYILSTPEKKYRKHPITYLNQRAWEDELIIDPDLQKYKTNGRHNTTQSFD